MRLISVCILVALATCAAFADSLQLGIRNVVELATEDYIQMLYTPARPTELYRIDINFDTPPSETFEVFIAVINAEAVPMLLTQFSLAADTEFASYQPTVPVYFRPTDTLTIAVPQIEGDATIRVVFGDIDRGAVPINSPPPAPEGEGEGA